LIVVILLFFRLIYCFGRILFGGLKDVFKGTAVLGRTSPATQLASKPATMSLASLKNRFLDNIRQQKSVIMANFGTTDMDIEIQMQPDSHLDPAKAKKAGAVTISRRTSQYSQSDTIQKPNSGAWILCSGAWYPTGARTAKRVSSMPEQKGSMWRRPFVALFKSDDV
jgi:hypothetical protein